jgi:predicted transcriptional regulator
MRETKTKQSLNIIHHLTKGSIMARGKSITVGGQKYSSASAAAFEMLKKTHLKQSDIAKMVGLTPQTVHRIMITKAGMYHHN